MSSKIILPIDVFVEVEAQQFHEEVPALTFWWSVYGFKPATNEVYPAPKPATYEDIHIHYRDKNGNRVHHSANLLTKGYFRNQKEFSNSLSDDELAQFCRETLDEECARFGTTLDGILNADHMLYEFSYSEDCDSGFYDGHIVPRDAQGSKPNYVAIFYPTEELTITVVKEAVSRFYRDFRIIPFPTVHLVNKPKRGHVRKNFKEYERFREEHERFREAGGTYRLEIIPEALGEIIGREAISGINDVIEYGFVREDGNFYVKLRHGGVRPIGPPNLRLVK